MPLKTESREVDAGSENVSFREYTDTSDAIEFHLNIRIPVRVPQIGQMRTPGCVFRVAFNDDSIFVQGLCQCQASF